MWYCLLFENFSHFVGFYITFLLNVAQWIDVQLTLVISIDIVEPCDFKFIMN